MILRVFPEWSGKQWASYHSMKSTPQSSINQSGTEFPAFHTLSSEYFGAETSRNQIVEFLLFTILGLVTAWPIISMVVGIGKMFRSY